MAGVSAQDVVGAAYQLLGAPYRRWFVGDPIPMWRKDGARISHRSLANSPRIHRRMFSSGGLWRG
jgi:hypothetical protein